MLFKMFSIINCNTGVDLEAGICHHKSVSWTGQGFGGIWRVLDLSNGTCLLTYTKLPKDMINN